jgi:hypothetical protein
MPVQETQMVAGCPVTVTCMKPVTEQQPYDYTVTTDRPEPRTRTIPVHERVPQRVSRQETYTVEVPEKRVRMKEVTEYHSVAEQQPRQYTLMVPYETTEHVQVPVCRMIERTVTEAVPVCSSVTARPTFQPVLPGESFQTPPLSGIRPARGMPGSPPAGYYASNYAGGPADPPIYRDLATGRTYRYPPAEIPTDRLVIDPWLNRSADGRPLGDGLMGLAGYGPER